VELFILTFVRQVVVQHPKNNKQIWAWNKVHNDAGKHKHVECGRRLVIVSPHTPQDQKRERKQRNR
jgi:hypothetical protein